ncbi:LacI family DNA-binding transcriptional regulator [Arsenicicoccus sp. oral taxon 190]|uniref:LacI family DNA-binding transcriptional regulator n=1 Tax=Arsenicicoccus sp. oral taxon 190 TaxID=1658671 RepID=UPI00067A2B86|nr:LacI family DNA-binding transcriptional regulator [Arsenicicoccus sp. oral taxon 190]AKT50891.1 hypothetical protein ADJ73_05455 [Arsenicicoccus sp. oral taxon 190]
MPPARVTIRDLARETGLSVSSVSVALRGDPGVSARSREVVQEAAARLGYRPDRRAQGLREHRSHLVGVTFWLHQTFHATLVEELYAAVAPTRYDLVLSGTTAARSVTDAIESLRHDRCDAIVLISPQLTGAELAALGERLPTVVVGSDLEAAGVDTVRADDHLGMRLVVDHLVRLGHERVCFVDGGDAVMSEARRRGYLDAARAHGLATDVIAGYPSEESGVRAAEQLLARAPADRPTAVVAHNDMVATGVLLTLRAEGVRVPQEVSVVGYDDSRLASLATVDLTTVSQEPRRLAQEALRLATTRAEGAPAGGAPVVVAPRLVIRSTT